MVPGSLLHERQAPAQPALPVARQLCGSRHKPATVCAAHLRLAQIVGAQRQLARLLRHLCAHVLGRLGGALAAGLCVVAAPLQSKGGGGVSGGGWGWGVRGQQLWRHFWCSFCWPSTTAPAPITHRGELSCHQ